MDFLSFRAFISIPVLIGFYYMGALLMPLFMWFFSTWLMKKIKILGDLHRSGKEKLWSLLSTKQKLIFVSMFIMSFLFMQLFWRMMFEFLIAYMQMRDALILTWIREVTTAQWINYWLIKKELAMETNLRNSSK